MALLASTSSSLFYRLPDLPSTAARSQKTFLVPVAMVTGSPSTKSKISWASRPPQKGAKKVASPVSDPTEPPTPASAPVKPTTPRVVGEIQSAEELKTQMALADEDDRLLVVEFTKKSLPNTQKNHQALVDLSSTMNVDVAFQRVFADHSAECREILVQNEVKQIPCYAFFRNGQKVHQEAGMRPEKLKEQVLYYGQAEYPVQQLESVADVTSLLKAHNGTGRLIVVQVTLTFCGPCVRVYPAVLQMSHKMAGSVVFARLFGDTDATKQIIKDYGIVEAPTFLFFRDEELLGRYVGSGKGELIGEVLRYQGVECT